MIPTTNSILTDDLEFENQPSKNYKMHIDEKVINGTCDDLESMKQVIYKILMTERYEYIIYSWDYGIELKDLYGQPVNYIIAELPRRITEALLADDRIESVTDFKFDTSQKKKVHCKFIVHTIFGTVDAERGVEY